MKTYRFLLAGLGNIGRNFLEIVCDKEAILRERYGVQLLCVAVTDSSGSVLNADGVDMRAIVAAKKHKQPITALAGGVASMNAVAALAASAVDVVFDSTPVDLKTGGIGLELTRNALVAGKHLAALSDLTDLSKPGLRFSGAVGGAMPTINVGRSDLAAAHISRIEAVLNGTTQMILEMMANGSGYDEAIREAIDAGIAETDPSLDVEGWDAANKLVILANAVLRQATTLADVSVTGINKLRADEVRAVRMLGERMSLLATAEWIDDHYKLTVAPTALPESHPFAQLAGQAMAIRYETDIYGTQTLITHEEGPVGSAAAMLRDFLDIVRNN